MAQQTRSVPLPCYYVAENRHPPPDLAGWPAGNRARSGPCHRGPSRPVFAFSSLCAARAGRFAQVGPPPEHHTGRRRNRSALPSCPCAEGLTAPATPGPAAGPGIAPPSLEKSVHESSRAPNNGPPKIVLPPRRWSASPFLPHFPGLRTWGVSPHALPRSSFGSGVIFRVDRKSLWGGKGGVLSGVAVHIPPLWFHVPCAVASVSGFVNCLQVRTRPMTSPFGDEPPPKKGIPPA